MTDAERIAELEAENARLEELVYVPGTRKCAKCDFVLVSNFLHAETGQISANDKPDDCPNGCGPLWRVTERDAGNDMVDRCEEQIEARTAAEARLREAGKTIRRQAKGLDHIVKQAEVYKRDGSKGGGAMRGAFNKIQEIADQALSQPAPVAEAERQPTWQGIQDAVAAWADEAFPEETLAGKMEHIRRETREIEQSPNDDLEWADVVLIFLNAMADHGMDMARLKQAVLRKFNVVRQRQWKPADERGVVEHVKAAREAGEVEG